MLYRLQTYSRLRTQRESFRRTARCLADIFNRCLVMEYAEHGELYSYLDVVNHFSAGLARRYFRQIVSGLAFIHSHGIAHRDMSLENVLLDSNDNAKVNLSINPGTAISHTHPPL